MIKHFFSCILILFGLMATAQDVSLALQKALHVTEAERTAAWEKVNAITTVSFATGSQRYPQQMPPHVPLQNLWQAKAWKNEKVHTQILVYSKKSIANLSVEAGDLKDGKGNTIAKSAITTGFVQYVITDEFKDGCGYRTSTDFDSSEVADIINTASGHVAMHKNTTQPIWLSIRVPANSVAGNYTGSITINAGKKITLDIALTVLGKTLPDPKSWKFRLDLWQHPAAIARVHNIPLWGDAHFEYMRKYYTMLAQAGQKIITASIVNEPWGHQTYDDYPSLIQWTKKKDGGWVYDYSLFDKYIAFVMSCGITQQINCYSMVPWKIAFKYYDEALQKDTVFTEAIGTPAYNEYWATMLKDFTRHLKAKNWFNITTIAMDERPMAAMQSVIALLKSIDKDWKISLAGDYHPEIEKDIFDYCIASRWVFANSVLNEREQLGKASTWYTCCTEKYPNLFTFSPPDEAVWIGWYTAAHKMDGYLRWAYNSWTRNPLHDSRFTAWPAGDTYQVYPGPLTSIRFEKTIEGIQDYEKINILLANYRSNNEPAKLHALETALKSFTIEKLASASARQMIEQVKPLLNE